MTGERPPLVRVITSGNPQHRVIHALTDDVTMKQAGVRVFNYPEDGLWMFFPWHIVESVGSLWTASSVQPTSE